MRIAVSQIDIAWEEVSTNLATMREQSQRAKQQGCDLCLFPEMAPCGFSMRSLAMAQACQPVPEHLQALAQQEQLWVGTSYVESSPDGGLPFNTFALAGPQGQWVCYRKMHPFSLAKEDQHYQRGQAPVSVTIAGLRCSLWVCYDLRFANAFWSRAEQTDAYLVIANWPSKRRLAWNSLLKARAIENQAYVVGCNRIGQGAGLTYQGDSCIIDPLGKTLIKAQATPALLVADLQASRVATLRNKLPFLKDRRSDF